MLQPALLPTQLTIREWLPPAYVTYFSRYFFGQFYSYKNKNEQSWKHWLSATLNCLHPTTFKKGVFGRNVLSAHDMTHQHFFQENWPPSDPDLAQRWKRVFLKRKVCLFSHHKCSHLWDFTSWNTMQLGFWTGFHTICLFIKRLSQISVSPHCSTMYLPLNAFRRKKTFWNETCLTTKMCFEIQRPSLKKLEWCEKGSISFKPAE